MKDDILIIIVGIILTLILGGAVLIIMNSDPPCSDKIQDYKYSSIPMIQNNTLMGSAPLFLPKVYTLGILLDKIVECESGGKPKVCNKEFGCRAGMGLCMFISGTWNETLDRMSCSGKYNIEGCIKAYMPDRCWEKVHLPVSLARTEAVFDTECNLLAGAWLLKKDGDFHWRPYSGSCYLKL